MEVPLCILLKEQQPNKTTSKSPSKQTKSSPQASQRKAPHTLQINNKLPNNVLFQRRLTY